MTFRHFPMDSQICPLHIESCKFTINYVCSVKSFILLFPDAYNAKDVIYSWKEPKNSVGVSDGDLALGLFEYVDHKEKSEFIQLETGLILTKEVICRVKCSDLIFYSQLFKNYTRT